MNYHFSTFVDYPFDEAVAKTIEALKEEGFGILTEIDVKETMKQKLDVDFRRYKILGACHPALAYRALQTEDKIGVMLPCNVVVQEVSNGTLEVSAVDPVASMMAIDNAELQVIAQEVQDKLKRVISSLQAAKISV